MGMFDQVKYSAQCPSCAHLVTSWQSKDGRCCFDDLEPWQVRTFYTSCPNCNTWIEASVEAEVEVIVKRCEITLKTGKI